MGFTDDPEAEVGDQLERLRATLVEVEDDLDTIPRWRWLRRRLTQTTLDDIREFERVLSGKLAREQVRGAARRDRSEG